MTVLKCRWITLPLMSLVEREAGREISKRMEIETPSDLLQPLR